MVKEEEAVDYTWDLTSPNNTGMVLKSTNQLVKKSSVVDPYHFDLIRIQIRIRYKIEENSQLSFFIFFQSKFKNVIHKTRIYYLIIHIY